MARRLALALLVVFFVAHPGWSQQQPNPARMSFTIGAGYDQGDFGTPDISRALYFPFSFRYTDPQFDFTVSSSIARLSASDGVRLIDGVPTPSIDSLEAVIRRYKAGDVVRVDVYQRKTRRTVPMTIRTRRPMQIATFESLGVPVPASVLEFRKSWLGSKRSSPATRD